MTVDADLPTLLNDLESPVDEVRLAALRRLERRPSLAALGALRRIACADDNANVRFEARRFLSAISSEVRQEDLSADLERTPTPDRLRSLLADPDPAVRVKVIGRLATMQEESVTLLLEEHLEREVDPFALCSLLQALAAARGIDSASLLQRHLASSDPRIRATAADSLGAIGDDRVLPLLVPLLQDPHHRVRVAAARWLRTHDSQSVEACVDEMLRSQSEIVLRSALYVLRFFPESFGIPRLKEGLEAPFPESQKMARHSLEVLAGRSSAMAARLLSRQPDTRDPAEETTFVPSDAVDPIGSPLEQRILDKEPDVQVPALLEAVRLARSDLLPRISTGLSAANPDPRVLATRISAVGRLGNSERGSLLRPLLQHQEPRIRANTVESIGLLQGPGWIGDLLPHLQDAHNRVRANAIVALKSAPEVDIIRPLAAMASSPNPRFRSSAAWAITQIGTSETVDLFRQMFRFEDLGTREAVLKALSVLSPTSQRAQSLLQSAKVLDSPDEMPGLPDAEIHRLIFDLRHESPQVRVHTIEAIGQHGDPRLLSEIQLLLRDDDMSVRHAAREAARKILQSTGRATGTTAEPAGEFLQRLAGSQREAQMALESVAEEALRLGPRAVADAIASHLPKETQPHLRASLLSALGLVGGPEVVALARAFLRDSDSRVRANAVDAIALAGSQADCLATAVCLADPDARVRGAAVRACLEVSPEVFVQYLRGMLVSPSVAERAAALHVARTARLSNKFELLRVHFLQETHPRLIEACADALSHLGAERELKSVDALLEEVAPGSRRDALMEALTRVREHTRDAEQASADEVLVGTTGQPENNPAVLASALQSAGDPLTITLLLDRLSALNTEDMFSLAQPFTYARDRRVRLKAVEVVAACGSDEALECLDALVQDRDGDVALQSLLALHARDPERTNPAVQQLIRTGHPWAARRGLELLEQLDTSMALEGCWTVLEIGAHPSSVEPLKRLLLHWGCRQSLLKLSEIRKSGAVHRRELTDELIRTLGGALQVGEEELQSLMPRIVEDPGLAVSRDTASASPSSPEPGRTPVVILIAAGFLTYGLFVSMAFRLFWPSLPETSVKATVSKTPGRQRSAHSTPSFRSPSSRTPSPPGQRVSFRAAFESGLRQNLTPTLRSLELQVQEELRAKGIEANRYARVAAFGRADGRYIDALEQARRALEVDDAARALATLQEALTVLEPDHLLARIELLRLAVEAARRGARGSDLRGLHDQLLASERELMDLVLDTATQAGATPGEVRAVKFEFDERQRRSVEALGGMAFLAGVPPVTAGP